MRLRKDNLIEGIVWVQVTSDNSGNMGAGLEVACQ
jgi:hypothetical protein